MKFVIVIHLLLLLTLQLFAVENGTIMATAGGVVTDSSESAPVFDQTVLRTYALSIDEKEWTYLQNNVIKEKYVPALLTVDGDTVGTVGIRFKGSTFTLEGCTGVRDGVVCDKISMKIRFDKFDKELRFHGLRRLNFNSMMYDATALHERLAYRIFAEMGVITSRAAHAKLVINGEYKGLFSLVEQIDDVFVKNRFPENDEGNLFKERWPVTADSAYYRSGLKTNRTKGSVALFETLFKELSAAEDSALPAVIKKYTDSDYLMRYMAVDRAISNWDGVTGFYPDKAAPGCYAGHNFYWYQEPKREHLWLLPWDLDGTMTLKTGFDHVPAWNEKVDNPEKIYSIFNGESTALAPYTDKFMRGWGILGNRGGLYKVYQRKLLSGPFREGYLERKIDEWEVLLAKAVELDHFGPSLSVWTNAVADIRNDISLLRERLKNDIDDVVQTPFCYSYTKMNKFEKVDSYDYQIGVGKGSNSKSCMRVKLNNDDALSGKQDVRIDFDMYNEIDDPEKGAFYQWVWLGGYFNKEQKPIDFDAKGIVGVEFVCKTDKKRKLWTSVTSSVWEKDNRECHWGWRAEIGPQKQRVKLYFKDGTFPFWMDKPEQYDIREILQKVTAFSISPVVEGLQENGIFAEGDHDSGYLQIDNIKFLRK